MQRKKQFLAALVTSFFAQSSSAFYANIQANPNLVGAENAVLSVMLTTEQAIPNGGGFRIGVPT